jgi:hypothetical protein
MYGVRHVRKETEKEREQCTTAHFNRTSFLAQAKGLSINQHTRGDRHFSKKITHTNKNF